MKFIRQAIPDVILVEPRVFTDDRGFFLETYHAERYAAGGICKPFVQDNHSRSTRRGVLRGLHSQLRRPQGKLVYAVRGAIWDVAVDVRRGSPTFGRWVGVELSEENRRQLYVPEGCLHGFVVLSDVADVTYKCTDVYVPNDEVGVIWNDPALAVAWPVADPLLSPKDAVLPRFNALRPDQFPVWTPPA